MEGYQSETAPVRVEVDSARMGDLVMRLSTTGLTRALRVVAISPKISGQVVQLAVAEGQFVRKNALLMKLDDRELRLALAEAHDKLLGAQAEFRLRWQEGALGAERLAKSDERGAKSVERGTQSAQQGMKSEERMAATQSPQLARFREAGWKGCK